MQEEYGEVESYSNKGTIKSGVKTFIYLFFLTIAFFVSSRLFLNRFDVFSYNWGLTINYPLITISYFLFIIGILLYATFFIHKNFISSLFAFAPFFTISLIFYRLELSSEEWGYTIFAVPYFFAFMVFVTLICFFIRFYYKINSNKLRMGMLAIPFIIFIILSLTSFITIATLNASDCASLNSGKEECYSSVAVRESNASICEDLGPYGYRCYSAVASASGDLSVCDEILLNEEVVGQFKYTDPFPSDFKIIGDCYKGVAISMKDTSICDKIPSDVLTGYKVDNKPFSQRDSCYSSIK